MLAYNTITIGGVKMYVEPENYQMTSEGQGSTIVATSSGIILDLGYVREGFQATGYITDADSVNTLINLAKSALTNKTPISVVDNVYPGGKTWTGFLRLPIGARGSMRNTGINTLPANVMVESVDVAFFSSELTLA